MLLGLDAMFFRRLLAEVKKPPDLPAKLGEIAVLSEREVILRLHTYIVSRYKWIG